jgi:hypothetical protein
MINKSYLQEEIDYCIRNYGKILVSEIAKKLEKKEHNIRYLMWKLRKQNKTKIISNLCHSPEQIAKMKENKSNKLIKTAFNLTPNLAYILGVMVGDGSFGYRRLHLGIKDKDFALYFKKILQEWSGLQAKIYKYYNSKFATIKYKQGFHFEIILNSIKAVEFLKLFNCYKLKKKGIENIKAFLKYNKKCELKFIEGFFDSEGSIRKEGRIALDNSKVYIINYLSYLLKKLKIEHKINYSEQKKRYKKQNIKMYRLYIQKKEDIRKFCNLINSSIKRKQDRILKFRTYD